MDAKNVVKIIDRDRRWHERNVNRLSATIRRNRIPHLKYYTTAYDNEKVHEHDYPHQIEEQLVNATNSGKPLQLNLLTPKSTEIDEDS